MSIFQLGWQQGRAFATLERERLGALNAPPVRNDPKLMALVTCRVLKAFGAFGRRVEAGEEIRLPLHDAASMRALGRVEIIEG